MQETMTCDIDYNSFSIPSKHILIEFIPQNMFVKKPLNFKYLVEKLSKKLSDKISCQLDFKNYSDPTHRREWTRQLFNSGKLTPFTHFWSMMVNLFDSPSTNTDDKSDWSSLFLVTNSQSPNIRCQLHTAETGGDSTTTTANSTCCCPGFQLSYCPNLPAAGSAVTFGSLELGVELVLAWALATIKSSESNVGDLSSSSCSSNMARQSYGVLQNWADLLLNGHLSPEGSNSVDIESDNPSFLDEHLINVTKENCPVVAMQEEQDGSGKQSSIKSSSGTVVSQRMVNGGLQVPCQILTVIIASSSSIDDSDDLQQLDADWSKLADVWRLCLQQRIKHHPDHLIVNSLDDDASVVDSIAQRALEIWTATD